MFKLFLNRQISKTRLMLGAATLTLSILLLGCGDRTEVTVLIDNPTTSELTIAIDDKAHTIAPLESYEIEIPYGMHSLEFTQGPFHDSIKQQVVNAYFSPSIGKNTLSLNPTNSTYVYTKEYYFENEKDAPTFRDNIFIINGLLYNDQDAIVQNGFVVDNYGGLNVNESFPDEIYVDKKQRYGLKTKLFRYGEYDNYYRTEWLGIPDLVDEVDSKPKNGDIFITFNKSFDGFNLSHFEGRDELIILLKNYESHYRDLINKTTSSKQFSEMSKQLRADLASIKNHPQYSEAKDSDPLNALINLKSDDGLSDINYLNDKVIFFKQ